MNARRLRWLALFLLGGCRAHSQEGCGVARDLMVRALEGITPNAGQPAFADGVQLLKRANEMCAGLGDAWYFRSLFETKLGRPNLADYALRKARLVGSEAMDQNADPFSLAAPETGVAPSGAVREKWALVIGISKFRDRRISSLRFTAKDSRDFADVLRDSKYGKFKEDHVRLLTDEQATTVRIKFELNWLARSAQPDDLVVLYLSSHGSPREMDTVGVNYVITHDTEIRDQDSLYATALPMVDFADVVRTRIKARRAAIFLDTCHSGGAVAPKVGASSASAETLERIRQGVGRVTITSSQVSEKSWESDRFQNGYFTHFLIEALKQDNGRIPIGKIYDYLKEQVSRQVMADVKVRQTPLISRSERGPDIVIGVDTGTARVMLWYLGLFLQLFNSPAACL